MTVLVFALPVLVVAFAILMGAASLTDALQDPFGAKCLRWVAAISAMLLVGDVLLLVGLLGLESLARHDNVIERSPESESSDGQF